MAKRFKKYQLHALNAAFEESEHLSKQKKSELVRATGLDVEQVTGWFNRERAKRRARESSEDLKRENAQLQERLREGKEREAELENELRETKKRKAELEAENWNLKQQLGIMDGCYSHCDPVLMFVKGIA
ncbi:hypothetical protein F511_18029 [Dorcoceras hygrometricum]|uniref:Homeobox domain-containing protein n=1 Tax=Dorcoceras hygrometricum TaxID=472368 RepID=A0A2Z7C772_9LAMI|nr:hypothetical protein F511_18029 [Dorcoceras hygrometricum]